MKKSQLDPISPNDTGLLFVLLVILDELSNLPTPDANPGIAI